MRDNTIDDQFDEYTVDQLRIHQEEIAIIRDELDEQASAYRLLDEAVNSISRGIDKGTIRWRLSSEDIETITKNRK